MEGDLYLISETYEKDELGQDIPTETKSEAIPCHTRGISGKEFHNAGQHGIKADVLIITQAVNYHGEEIAEFEGNRYGIYRHYPRMDSDEVELYCEWKGGISEQSQD